MPEFWFQNSVSVMSLFDLLFYNLFFLHAFISMLLSNFLNLLFNLLVGEGMYFVLTMKSFNFFLTNILKIVEISSLETHATVGSVSVLT